MSKKNWKPNYTNYTKPATTNDEDIAGMIKKEEGDVYEDADVEIELPVEEPIIEETPEVPPKEKVLGFVNGTVRLNVRTEPNKDSEAFMIIDRLTEVVIDPDESTGEWYSVEIDGVHGFCMKKYINLK